MLVNEKKIEGGFDLHGTIKAKIEENQGTSTFLMELVDNSIGVSDDVEVTFDEKNKAITVVDNGKSMSLNFIKEKLFKYGSVNHARSQASFNRFGTGVKIQGSFCRRAEIRAQTSEELIIVDSVYNEKRDDHYDREIRKHKRIDNEKTGTSWMLHDIMFMRAPKRWATEAKEFYSKLQKRYEHKLANESIKYNIRVKYINGKGEEAATHKVKPRNFLISDISSAKLKTEKFYDQFGRIMTYKFCSYQIPPDKDTDLWKHNKLTQENNGVHIFWNNILIGVTKGFFSLSSTGKNRSASNIKENSISSHHNGYRQAIFLTNDNIDAFGINTSKNITNGFIHDVKVNLAKEFSYLNEDYKLLNGNGGALNNKKSMPKKIAGCPIRSASHFGDSSVQQSIPFRKEGGDINFNENSNFCQELMQQTDEKPIKNFVMPIIGQLSDYAPEFAKRHGLNLKLLTQFVEEALERHCGGIKFGDK